MATPSSKTNTHLTTDNAHKRMGNNTGMFDVEIENPAANLPTIDADEANILNKNATIVDNEITSNHNSLTPLYYFESLADNTFKPYGR